MPKTYKSFSIRNRIFFGFLSICVLSMLGSAFIYYIIISRATQTQNKIEMQKTAEILTASLDYAVSRDSVTPQNLKEVLRNKIKEIADINKHDIVIYTLDGHFLLSNKTPDLIKQKEIPTKTLLQVLKSDSRIDIKTYDAQQGRAVVSSYILLKNNIFEPIGVVYYPSYHSASLYRDVLEDYLSNILIFNVILIFTSVLLSWIISKRITRNLTEISESIKRISLFNRELTPIKYNRRDELGILIKSYNNLVLQIDGQKERLSHIEKETAWREMAKQVAHEVKNPLTPMKLLMQNFERKFNPQDPEAETKVKELSESIISQIDIISKVATAFSEFAKLPKREDEQLNLNEEIKNIITLFDDRNIFFHANQPAVLYQMDKTYFTRILNNLITNAIQAEHEARQLIINVDLENRHSQVRITVEDNGTGITEDKINHIFEPNFTSKNSGMGLGLTMVKKMIEDYQGSIEVKTQVGRGTKFIINLPKNASA
ncbi:sensor histidine kinase [Riemerella columbina]|uniref:sensor histidine kinase n=1 Tax=Riemerella columbina TaxID=103810 RepID=UPI0026701810|nr:HAMP domain-containing sensor histidine kinase [Riemerella columbina]WKS95612.1 HAMP domain-containing histidine kinase [Riemerella columbina]